MATLVILQGPNSGREFALGDGCSILGRQPNSTVYLDSLAVSRQHARILWEKDSYFLEDLGSSNGTYLNCQRISGRERLSEGDQIQVGPYVLALKGMPVPVPPEAASVIRSKVHATIGNSDLFLQNPAHKLKVIVEIAQSLARTLEMEALLNKLLEQLLRLFPQADRGLVILCEGDRLVLRAFRGRRTNVTEGSYSRTVVQQALSEGVGLLSEDVPSDSRLVKSETLVGLQLRSFLCVPIIASDGLRLGALQLDCITPGMAFRDEDLELLTAIALQVSVVMENATLHSLRLHEERLRQELALAREIQQGYLPTEFTTVGGAAFDLFARVHPAREVSGDLYDFFPLSGDRLAFFVGDVSGKGMPAALFMIAVRTLARHLTVLGGNPSQTLEHLNEALGADNPSCMFVTLCHGLYTWSTGEVVIASGGHPPPLLRHANGQVEVAPVRNGRLLGYPGGNLRITNTTLTLAPGDTLALYTDGYTEAKAPDGDTMYGSERLAAALGGARTSLSLETCAEEMKREIVRFTKSEELQDDLTLLLLRRK